MAASKTMGFASKNGKANDLTAVKGNAEDDPAEKDTAEKVPAEKDQNEMTDSQAKPLETFAEGLIKADKAIDESPASSRTPELENLNKIRDILFGQQVQTHDQRFEQLERRLVEECADLRADFDRRMNSLESRLVNRLDSLTQRLQTEETARKDAAVRLSHTITESERASERRASQLEGKINAATHDLHTEIKHQTLTLKDLLEQQIYEIATALEKETTARKRSTEAERTQLSKLLGELSKQLESEA